MTDLKISQLPAAPSIESDGELAIAQDVGAGLTTYRASVSQLQQNSNSIRVSVNYTTMGERYIFVTDVTTVPVPRTITLATADFTGKAVITIKDETNTASTNNIVLITQGGETINNGPSSVDITSNGGSITLVSDGVTWESIIPDDTGSGSGELVLVNTAGGPVTQSLPTPASAANKVYYIKDESGLAATNNITVDVSGGGNIDGSATVLITAAFGIGRFISNGTQWWTL